MQIKCLEIWLLWGCRGDLEELALWNFGVLEVSEGALGCWKCFLVFNFCLNIYVEQKHVLWNVYLRGLDVFRLQKHLILSVECSRTYWELWECLDSNSTWLERFECWEIHLRGWRCLDFKNMWFDCFKII